MSDIEKLLAELEKASEGSRDFDVKIYAFVMDETAWRVRALMPKNLGLPPHYTTSLDAALKLYLEPPERIPSDARLACIEALEQRNASA
ncbi:MAG: hypothetical protein ACR2QC_04100 [Gammaproteobacteria bacterium]